MIKPSKTCLVICDFHAVRSPLTHLVLQKQFPHLNMISAGVNPGQRDSKYIQLANEYSYDFKDAPQQDLQSIDLSKVDLAISYSVRGYQLLLEAKRYNPDLKVVFWSLGVPNFDIKGDINATFEAFLDEIQALINNDLDFLT